MIEEVISYDVSVLRVHIKNQDMAMRFNKPIGHYTTLDTGPLIDDVKLEKICNCLTEELRRYLSPYEGKTLCICGIGNDRQLTDSLGPETARRITPRLPMQPFFEKVVVFRPGTFGETNIEKKDAISAIASVVDASCVLAIDALDCTSPKRIGSTIQISDTGLEINWSKEGVNSSTIGIPVISIGVPTVIRTKRLNVNVPCDDVLTVSNIERVVKNATLVVACAVMQVAYPELNYSFAHYLASSF